MELQSKQLLGLTVFSITDGKKLGQIKDYVLDPAARAVTALIVGGTKRFRDESILPFENIKGISKEAITVETANALGRKQEFPHLLPLLKAMPDVNGLSVMTENGQFLGKAADFIIDGNTGAISRITLKNGLFDDLLKGKNELPIEDVTVFGSDVIITAPGTVPRSHAAKTTTAKVREAPKSKELSSVMKSEPISDLKQKIPSFKETRRTLRTKTETWRKNGYGAKIAALSHRDKTYCSEITPEEQSTLTAPTKMEEKKTASAPEQRPKRAKAGISYISQKVSKAQRAQRAQGAQDE